MENTNVLLAIFNKELNWISFIIYNILVYIFNIFYLINPWNSLGKSLSHKQHISMAIFSGKRYKGSNTGKRASRKNLRYPRERFLVSNKAPPSWRPIEIFPAGVWDFCILPSYRCLILFLTNFPILYVFRCFILFLTKHPCFVYIPSSIFPQNCFPLVKLIVDLSIYIRVLAVFNCISK